MTCQPIEHLLLHLAERGTWESSMKSGAYDPPGLREAGFVHLCTPAQLEGVANAFYAGRRDLMLLVIDARRLDPEGLRWEPPAPPDPSRVDPAPPGSLFPHLHGALPVDAVVEARPYLPDPDGRFRLPARLAGATPAPTAEGGGAG